LKKGDEKSPKYECISKKVERMQNLEVTATPKIEVRPAAFQDDVRSIEKTIPLAAPTRSQPLNSKCF
jgi:hypothetical protein